MKEYFLLNPHTFFLKSGLGFYLQTKVIKKLLFVNFLPSVFSLASAATSLALSFASSTFSEDLSFTSSTKEIKFCVNKYLK